MLQYQPTNVLKSVLNLNNTDNHQKTQAVMRKTHVAFPQAEEGNTNIEKMLTSVVCTNTKHHYDS